MLSVIWSTNAGRCRVGPMPAPEALDFTRELLRGGYRDAAMLPPEAPTPPMQMKGVRR